MSKDDRQVRIDEYLLGQTDANGRRELEEEISRNAALSEQLADTELAMAAIELAEDQALKARLQKLEVNLQGQSTESTAVPQSVADGEATIVKLQPRKNRRLFMGIAAAVLLLLTAGWFMLQPKGYDSPAALAMATYEPYANITSGTVRGGEADPAAAAFTAYDAGDFKAAATAFATLPATAVNKFYLGQSLLGDEQFAAAAAQFTDLTKADFGLRQESEYYLALARLGAGETELAKTLLTTIGESATHPMQTAAQQLLTELGKLK
ncbi:MAG: hypothetical protein AAF597_09305 [Bacteroidota bacterium]